MMPTMTISSRVLYLIVELYGTFLWACWVGGLEGGVCSDGIHSWHVDNHVKGLGKGVFEGTCVLGCHSGRECHLTLGGCAPCVAICGPLLQGRHGHLCAVELGSSLG